MCITHIKHLPRTVVSSARCDLARTHAAALHEKCLIHFTNVSFLGFAKKPSGGPGNILQMGESAWKFEKSDTTFFFFN